MARLSHFRHLYTKTAAEIGLIVHGFSWLDYYESYLAKQTFAAVRNSKDQRSPYVEPTGSNGTQRN